MLTPEQINEIEERGDAVSNERSYLAPDLRALLSDRKELLAALQQAESQAALYRSALDLAVAVAPHCGICDSEELAHWLWSDEDGVELVCDKHKNSHFHAYGPNPIDGMRELVAALTAIKNETREALSTPPLSDTKLRDAK